MIDIQVNNMSLKDGVLYTVYLLSGINESRKAAEIDEQIRCRLITVDAKFDRFCVRFGRVIMRVKAFESTVFQEYTDEILPFWNDI